jgi:long-chain acyl-CoA synthetase
MSEYASLPAMFFDKALRGGAKPRYLSKRSGHYEPTTWEECRRAVEELGAGLLLAGLKVGDRVAILASTRPEWMETDFAALAAGAVTIPIYPSSLASECGYILVNSGARTVFVENAAQAAKVHKAIADGVELEGARREVALDRVVVMEGTAPGCVTAEELRRQGREALERVRAELLGRTASLSRADLATIVYTSGTTGLPKGVPQTHGNHLAALEAIGILGAVQEGEIDFEFLPLAHSFGRMLEYLGVYLGTVTAYARSIDTLLDDISDAKPHLIPSVPRIFEKVYAGVQAAREAQGAPGRAVFDWAVGVGERRAQLINEGREVPVALGLRDALAHRLVFSGIHERLGGRVRYMMSGGAPLAPEIARFFHAVGLPVLEGYGLTETTPILTCNRPGATRIGTVGMAVRGVELAIAEDGEILARGPNVAAGYYERPAETAESWDDRGWFHTGDIGHLEDGFLRITDRKKELIKTAGGKYVAPQKIENMLKSRPLISQAVVIGDMRKFCVALLTVDPDDARRFAADHSMAGAPADEILGSEELVRALATEVEAVNADLASFESIKYFRVLPRDFSVDGGELTPSLKIKRKVIAARYAETIDSMY